MSKNNFYLQNKTTLTVPLPAFLMFSVESTVENADGQNSTEKPLIVKSTDKDNGLPKETQMAQCTVTSGDIKASAQATFSKKLEGFCSTGKQFENNYFIFTSGILEDMIDLKENLAAMETRLYNELYDLKHMMKSLMPQNNYGQQYQDYHRPQQNYYQPQQYRDNYYNPHQGFNSRTYEQHENSAPAQNYHQNNIQQNFQESSPRPTLPPKTVKTAIKPETSTAAIIFTSPPTKQPEVVNVMRKNLKSLESSKNNPKNKLDAITQHPITVPTTATTTTEKPSPQEPPKNEYTYYWKLENFPKVFRNARKQEVHSHTFNVKGLFLRIRANMKYQEDQNLLFDIEHLANIESGDKMEIEINDGDDGVVFKEIAEEKLFQYSFAIMDLSKPNHDLISPIYWNIDTDNFLVPNSVHVLANYLKNDSLLIKLIITF